MTTYYSVFVGCEGLFVSPYIQSLREQHDLSLRRGEPEIVTFLVQYPIPPELQHELCIIYDPALVDVQKVDVESFTKQTLLTVTLIPKEIGSMKIGFSLPQQTKSCTPELRASGAFY